jgi:hypothetical protein
MEDVIRNVSRTKQKRKRKKRKDLVVLARTISSN